MTKIASLARFRKMFQTINKSLSELFRELRASSIHQGNTRTRVKVRGSLEARMIYDKFLLILIDPREAEARSWLVEEFLNAIAR